MESSTVKFEKRPVEAHDFMNITEHFRGIFFYMVNKKLEIHEHITDHIEEYSSKMLGNVHEVVTFLGNGTRFH